jgi:hypothetical protein
MAVVEGGGSKMNYSISNDLIQKKDFKRKTKITHNKLQMDGYSKIRKLFVV